MAKLTLTNISKHYGDFAAVENLDLDVSQGEFIILLGPSGCGKTTTLRMIAGFIRPSGGSIIVGEKNLTSIPPYRRNLGIVFQNYAVFPHLNVFENVAFGLRRRRHSGASVEAKAMEALRRVKLDHLRDRLPKQLSGGQQQRVAIARALAIEPDVFLLDEPLSNLDAKLRHEVRHEIHSLQRDLGITTVMVTHDQEEALSLGDRLVVMDKGKVQQIGSAREIYESPANLFVADFIGQTNILYGAQSGADQRGFVTESRLTLLCRNSARGAAAVVIRPEAIQVLPDTTAGGNGRIPSTITSIMYVGPTCEIRLKLSGGDALRANVSANDVSRLNLHSGQNVLVEIPPESAYALPG